MKKLHIVKIGGRVIDDHKHLGQFLKDFAALRGSKILVHGGGKVATDLANTLGIKQTIIDGRRVTDAASLNVTVMVYAGLINKTIVAKLQAEHCNAIGLSGADGNIIRSKKRKNSEIDFGFAGDVPADGIDVKQFENMLNEGITPVISPITHDGNGNLLNTNADTIATVIALALRKTYDVALTFCFEKKGVLMDTSNEESYSPVLNIQDYLKLKTDGIISKGMIPKLDNAFGAVEAGLKQVVICHAKNIQSVGKSTVGTKLIWA